MQATDFEFRYRALLIGIIYFLGFEAYAIDHTPIAVTLLRWTFGPNATHGPLVRIPFAIATVLVAFGAFVRTWGTAYLRASVVHDAKLHSTELVADGPYRYVRHPLYFGSIIATIGVGLVTSRLGFFVLVVPMTLLYLRLTGREEAQLKAQLDVSESKSYLEFHRRVPRLWPALTPRVPATGAKPKWGQAFLGEAFMWGFTLAIAGYAITLNETVLFWLIGVAVLALIEQQIAHNRRKKRAEQTA